MSAFVTVRVPRIILLSAGTALVAWLITLPAIIRSGSLVVSGIGLFVLVLACQGLMWAVAEGPSMRARYIIALSILGSLVLQLRLW